MCKTFNLRFCAEAAHLRWFLNTLLWFQMHVFVNWHFVAETDINIIYADAVIDIKEDYCKFCSRLGIMSNFCDHHDQRGVRQNHKASHGGQADILQCITRDVESSRYHKVLQGVGSSRYTCLRLLKCFLIWSKCAINRILSYWEVFYYQKSEKFDQFSCRHFLIYY